MRLALSEISTSTSFATDVTAYAAAGFDGIGLWEFKLGPATADPDNRARLGAAGLGVANCVPVIPSILPLRLPGMEGPHHVAERVRALCRSMERFAPYEPDSVLVITGPSAERAPAEARGLVVDGLREVAAAARAAGVRLGLEPIHPSQRDTVSFVNSIADALALLDEAGLDDVGLMADTFNLWHESPEALAAVASRVTGLHVADEPREPERTDRALPGEGGARSAELVRALVAAGWDGYLDVEIFSGPDGFLSLDVEEAAARAYDAVRALAQTVP